MAWRGTDERETRQATNEKCVNKTSIIKTPRDRAVTVGHGGENITQQQGGMQRQATNIPRWIDGILATYT